MDPLIGLAWMLAGGAVGAMAMQLLGPGRARRDSRQARAAMADSQQRRALERSREDNRDLEAQIEAANQRHARAIDSLKKAHASEVTALTDELKQERQKLRALVEASTQGHVISGTSFEATRFDDEP